MSSIKVIGDDLNGLGITVKDIIETNISNQKTWRKIKNIKGSLVIVEKKSNIAITVFFDNGQLSIKNGITKKPSASLEAGFEELAAVSSGQTGPIMAVVTRKIAVSGNLFKLLIMAKALISSEES